MPYSDRDKQREANRIAKRKERQGMTEGMTSVVVDKVKSIKVVKVCYALDRDIEGLAGKRENMLDLVSYGGIPMREVRRVLMG